MHGAMARKYCNTVLLRGRILSVVNFVPAIAFPVRMKKGEEETSGVLGAQELTVLSIRRAQY